MFTIKDLSSLMNRDLMFHQVHCRMEFTIAKVAFKSWLLYRCHLICDLLLGFNPLKIKTTIFRF